MNRSHAFFLLFAGLLLLPFMQTADAKGRGYCAELMSEEEFAEHRARMHAFETDEEREAYRREHHKLMQQRAKERGISIPDEPRAYGKGMKAYGDGGGRGYARQLMTEQEFAEHRARMRSFETEEEREAYHREHRKRMQERAREKGIRLAEESSPCGRGMKGHGGGAGHRHRHGHQGGDGDGGGHRHGHGMEGGGGG